jgi:hypothetical protein
MQDSPKHKEEAMHLLGSDARSVNRLPSRGPVDEEDYDEPSWAKCQVCCGKCCGFFWLITCCGCCCNPYKTVTAGNKGIITKFGRVRDVVDPGMHYVNPLAEKLQIVDIKAQVKKLDRQEVMSMDQLPVLIEGDVFWRRTGARENRVLFKTFIIFCKDAVKSTFGVLELDRQVDQISMNCLRNVFGR